MQSREGLYHVRGDGVLTQQADDLCCLLSLSLLLICCVLLLCEW
jgi:hypothetical protein